MISCKQIKALFRMLPDPVWLKDPHGVYLAVNARFEELFGVKEALLLGKTDYDFVPEAEAELHRAHDLTAIATGKPCRHEEWLSLATGSERRLFDISRSPLHDDEGTLTGVIGTARDITLQHETEEELLRRDAQNKLITDAVPSLISYIDCGYCLRFANESYLRWFGACPEQIIGRQLREVIGEEAWVEVHPFVDRALSGEQLSFERKLHYKSSPPRWIRASYTPHRDVSGKVKGIVALITDITPLKQVEEKLQQSQQQNLSLLNSTPAVLYRYSQRRGGLYYSPRVEEYLGYPPEHLLANATLWHDSIHPDDLPAVDAALAYLQCGRGFDLEYRIRHRNGTWRWFHDQSISHLHEDGEMIVDGIANDITLRKKVEEELREERSLLTMRVEERTLELTLANKLLVRELLDRERTMKILQENEERIQRSETLIRSVTDGTTDAIFVLDRAGKLVFANPAAHELFGQKPGELLGKTAAECFPDPETGQAIKGSDLRIMASAHAEMIEETLPLGGDIRFFLTTKTPRLDTTGRVIGLIGIARDITDRKQADELLAEQKHHDRLNMELVLAGARERRRVSAVLHDQIGQNLLLQKLKLRMLEDTTSTPPELQMLSEIRELLDESIAGVRSLTVQLCPPILATLGLTAAVEWLGKKFKSDYNLQVQVTDDGTPKPLDQERREVVYQAIRELLMNVTKHAHTEQAELTMHREGEQLVVVVADGGRGCVSAAKPGTPPGDGYGLHFIKRNMEHFGGEMNVVSEPGHGTRVTLRFPLHSP